MLTLQRIYRCTADIAKLDRKAVAWQADRNQQRVTIDWHFTTADARIKLKRLYPVL